MLSSWCASAVAQDPGPINTERPSFSSSPYALTRGYWQFEGGYQYSYTDDNDVREHTVPGALLRWGFADELELQLQWTGYSKTKSDSPEVSGVTDAELGVKWQVTSADAPLAIGLYGAVTVPVGDDELTSEDYDPVLAVFWAGGGFFGAIKATESEDQSTVTNAIGYGFSFNDTTGGFLELQTGMPEGKGPAHQLNGGVTFARGDSLQFDIHASAGLNDRAVDYIVGAGLATRW